MTPTIPGHTTPSDPRLAEALAYVELQRLQSRYAAVVTRRAWDGLADFVRADCPIVVDGRRTDAYGVYHDRLERSDGGGWRFARRHCRSFARNAEPRVDADYAVIDLADVLSNRSVRRYAD